MYLTFLLGCLTIGILTFVFLFYKDILKHKTSKKPLNFRTFDSSTIVTPSEDRKSLIKDRFHPSKTQIPEDLDYIVIGSGIGGLSCAAALSRCGRKVWVLEQHDRLGGCMHTFGKKFNFDVGIHYIGDVDKYYRRYLNTLITEEKDKVEWIQLGTKEDGYTYDRLVIGRGEKAHVFYARAKQRIADLQKFFSKKEDLVAIERYKKAAERSHIAMGISFMGRLLNPWIGRILFMIGRWTLRDVWGKSVQQVFDSLFSHNPLLKMNLSAIIGDLGRFRKDTSFALYMGVVKHYNDGGFYPKGGPNSITLGLIPTIEKSGGRCLARAPVQEIIFENGRAVGVVVSSQEKLYQIYCRCGVISAAGVRNTYTRFAPLKQISSFCPKWYIRGIEKLINKTPVSAQHFQIFIGFNKPQSELKLPSYNTWFLGFEEDKDHGRYDYDAMLETFHKDPINGPLFGFIGFPSAKDPDYATRHPGKSSCVIVTEVPTEFFKEYEELTPGARGEEYNALKKKIGMKFVEDLIFKEWPQVRDCVQKIEYGSPLTSKHYLGAPNGESYGLHSSMERYFDFDLARCLVPKTPIKGLYLCGQDIFSPGWAGGFRGGIATAESILGYHSLPVFLSGRNLMGDLSKLDEKKE